MTEPEISWQPPEFKPVHVDEAWMARRQQVHQKYEDLVGINDGSRLGYIHADGPRQWTEDEVVERWRIAAASADRRRDAINHVYIHVPFCKSICHFCNYERLRPSSSELLDEFTDRVFRSLHAIGPAVQPMKWHTLYFGGGTASVLPPKMLKTVLTALDTTLRWHKNSTRFFEFDPAVFNAEKLEVLMEHGFEHFSFGVQTLDAAVNQAHNRGPQSRDIVNRRFAELRAAGVFNISCDFLLGLDGTTPEGIISEIEEVLALQPRWVDLYFLTPTKEYVDSHFGGDFNRFWAHIKPFHDVIPQLAREAGLRHGFRVRRGHGHSIILYRQMGPHERQKHKSNGIFSYTQLVDQQRRPLHLLGLGTSARSLIFGQAGLQCRNPDEINDSGGPHYYVGNDYGMEGEIRLFLAHMLRDNDLIDRPQFYSLFGMDITEAIPVALSIWASEGLVTLTPEHLRMTPQDRRARCTSLLWVVPDGPLEYENERAEENLKAQARTTEHRTRHQDDAQPSPR